MSKLVIKDLAESIDLDREAMTAVVGGARVRGHLNPAQVNARATRVVDYPNTLPRQQAEPKTQRHIRSR